MSNISLKSLGLSEKLENAYKDLGIEEFELGRVVLEHKERYLLRGECGELNAEVTGNLRFSAISREDFPAVGDWVCYQKFESEFAIIHSVLPRFSVLSRKAVGKFGEKQIIAANIDFALLLQAVDRDFNINRLERYLTICYSSNISPIIVLTKIDLIEKNELTKILDSIKNRIESTNIFAISNNSLDGIEDLKGALVRANTYCLLGSSGVGKSTLTNNLLGKKVMDTDSISESNNKGRHITSHRELFILPQGSILIDNPGMREVGVADNIDESNQVFENIVELSRKCKFNDCSHINENGCAVLKALELNEIDEASYKNYLKIKKEQEYFSMTVSEKRRKEKEFGKMVKNFKNDIKKVNNKYKSE